MILLTKFINLISDKLEHEIPKGGCRMYDFPKPWGDGEGGGYLCHVRCISRHTLNPNLSLQIMTFPSFPLEGAAWAPLMHETLLSLVF